MIEKIESGGRLLYMSQCICFARESSDGSDFNIRNNLVTVEFLNPAYRYHKRSKTVSTNVVFFFFRLSI